MTENERLFKQAQKYIPGGVNSPVRAFRSVGSSPLFIVKGKGCSIVDADGKKYLDFIMSWGALILGHSHSAVVEAVHKAAADGTSFGAATERETGLARLICDLVPGVEKVRLVNSGTEATMSAVRLARGATGRDKIIKFEGCYHGHADAFLVKSGSGTLTYGHPSSPGVPASVAKNTLVARYNDLASVRRLFELHKGRIACVIVEPVAANMGVVLPKPGFLSGLRTLTRSEGSLLIFDEVITGFRLGPGGAQRYFRVIPDITTLGKIIGGGLPVGAFGASSSLMDTLAPQGPVYQAGTLSGNPCAVAAGIATLETLKKEKPYKMLARNGSNLFHGIMEIARRTGVPIAVNSIASMGSVFFGVESVKTYEDVVKCDTGLFARFHRSMLDQGIYLAPSQFETLFLSSAHSEKTVDRVLSAVETFLKKTRPARPL